MTRQTLVERLVKLLQETQARLSQEPTTVNEECVPLRDLPQFDSLIALEVSVELETEFGCISDENIFFDDRTKRPLSVSEIADRLAARLDSGEPTHG